MLFASLQPTLPVLQTSVDLADDRCWKRLPQLTAASSALSAAGGDAGGGLAASSAKLSELIERHLPQVNRGFALLPWTVHAHSTEALVEQHLRLRIEEYRGRLLSPALRTVWDEELCYFLEPALAAYESERCIGHAFGVSESGSQGGNQ